MLLTQLSRLPAVVAITVFLIAAATPAAGQVVELNLVGEGTVIAGDSSCWDVTFAPGCTMKATGTIPASGATFLVELKTSPGPAELNADGGLCLIANRSREFLLEPREQMVLVTASDGASIALNTIGTLCEENGPQTSYHYNGTYRIAGNSSTGRFFNAVGGGSFNLTFYRIAPGTTTFQLHGTIRLVP